MTDKTFIRFGIIFMVLTPVLMTPLYKQRAVRYWDDGTKIDGLSVGMVQERDWRRTWPLSKHPTTKERAELGRREYRNMLLDSESTPYELSIDHLSESYLRWLVSDLEGRPPDTRYDVKCIRLLGRVKNYLKSLDSAESGDILEMLPEQTTTTRDKSC